MAKLPRMLTLKKRQGPAEWTVLMCEEFNEQSNKYFTQIMISLHDNFAEAIDCDVGEFQLTPDKCNDIMSTMKKKTRRIVNDHSKSGNGSDMAKFDDDTDDEGDEIEDGDDESGPAKGYFNQDKI
jgi:hypothetical protein